MRGENEIVLFQPDGAIRLEVLLDEDTVWLTQTQMVELFKSSKANVSEHIKHIVEEGELVRNVVVRKFRTTTQHPVMPDSASSHPMCKVKARLCGSGFRVEPGMTVIWVLRRVSRNWESRRVKIEYKPTYFDDAEDTRGTISIV
jgi:hypothetical protein